MNKKFFLPIFLFASIFAFSNNSSAIQSGMSVDFGVDYGFKIAKSDSFKTKEISIAANPPTPAITFPAFNLNQDLDYMYGGDVRFGYMMENGVAASVGIGYHQSQINHKENKNSNIKPTLLSGMINLDYMLDLGVILYPYISVGAGLGRLDMKGKFENGSDVLEFKSLKKNKFMYQAGAGVLIKNFGIGYKFLGMMDLEDSETINDLKVSVKNSSGNYDISSDAFKFGTFENKNHIVTAFMKFVI
jgi:opacity protein-like surface antigen